MHSTPQAFGHPPEEAGEAGEEGAEGEGGGLNKQLSDTQKALLEWQRTASDKLRMQAAAQAAVAEVAAETQGTADGGAARDPAAPASAGGHRLMNVRSDGSVRAATP